MTRFPRIALLVFFSCAPVFAQGSGYSFDNFDTANGVRIRVEPAKARKAPTRRAAKTNLSIMSVDANNAGQALSAPASNSRPLPGPTASVYDSLASASVNQSSALRGYTTGNAQVDEYLINSGANNGVDPLLLYSIMHQESSFKSHAISPKGARGLMQLMPFTAMRYGVTNIFDPRQNIEGGARYLRFLLDHFDEDVDLVLAGYNAGEGAVEKYGGRVPPYSETQEYVRRISRRYALLRDPNAALYAPRLTAGQLARMQSKQSAPLTVYERTVLTVRLPDGRLQLMSQ
ncbi:MAG TPA: lytic transglycosylase domain-containing protein [Pyrinomonadaceae bacterium]|nr:lytic transglycosylase domain-containing protein [Pyrinomonadaceae bacterium]